MAVVTAVAEEDSRGRAIDEDAAGIAQVAVLTGLPGADVSAAVRALREAGVLIVRGSELRLERDLYCTLPALAELDWEGCRQSIERSGGRLSPALALLRELARMSRLGTDGGGDWLHPAVQELVEETLYGRTAVTQALGDLIRGGLVIRAEQPPRKGLRIRLAPQAFGRGEGAGPKGSSQPSRPSASATGAASAGVIVQIGGATIGVPAGSRLQLPPGMDYRLEIGPDGGAVIRIDD